jgi:precorrin-3B synthase
MPTGDGLLARWLPLGPIPVASFAALCRAGARDGNGIVEVTQRGSLQFRGLRPATVAAFAQAVDSLSLATNHAPPIASSPLLGLDPDVSVDLREWLVDFRAQVGHETISPKVGVLVDDGGALHLDDVAADIRLRLGASSRLHLSIGGTALSAQSLGWVDMAQAGIVVNQLLEAFAAQGPATRAHDLPYDSVTLREQLALKCSPPPCPPARSGMHPLQSFKLNDGMLARGVGLAFGYGHVTQFEALIDIASAAGAKAMCPVPGRAMLIIGLRPHDMDHFLGQVEALGFLVSPQDIRRQVVACAGAPACRSGRMPARELAQSVADAARGRLPSGAIIHLSGCDKGCAHPRRAAFTLVGPGHLIREGRADGPATDLVTPAQFVARLPALLRGAYER